MNRRTGREREIGCTETDELLAGYVLDALDPEEHVQVRAHLATCTTCQAKAAELAATANALAEAAPEVAPPPELRQRLLAQARLEQSPGAPPSGYTEMPRALPDRLKSVRRSARWSPWLAAAAAALLALAGGGWGLAEHFARPPAVVGLRAAGLRPVERLIAQGNSTVINLSHNPGASARGALITDPKSGVTYLLLTRVPALHHGRVYALWYMGLQSGSLRPFLIGQVARPGAFRIGRSPAGFSRAAITREPRAGDSAPQGPVILTAPLA